jgi:hypothetical protein
MAGRQRGKAASARRAAAEGKAADATSPRTDGGHAMKKGLTAYNPFDEDAVLVAYKRGLTEGRDQGWERGYESCIDDIGALVVRKEVESILGLRFEAQDRVLFREYLPVLKIEAFIEAAEITRRRVENHWSPRARVNYFFGILRNWKADSE